MCVLCVLCKEDYTLTHAHAPVACFLFSSKAIMSLEFTALP